MKKPILLFLAILLCSSVVMAQAWSPTPMVIETQDVVPYEFDGSNLEIQFNLSGKSAKIWMIIETKLNDEDKPIAVMNGFKGWHFVNGIDTTVYVSTARQYDAGTDLIFPWSGEGNEKSFDEFVSSGLVDEDTYTYYLWGFDDKSNREIACDFIPISYWWEAQYMRIYTQDEDGSTLNAPMLMGTLPFNQMATIRGSELGVDWPNGTIMKWQLGNDPTDFTLLETSLCLGFSDGEVFDDEMVAYGAGIFDPTDHDVFYFTKNHTWEQRHTPTKWNYVAGGQAIQDTDWGDFENVSWFHPGNKGDFTLKAPMHTDGNYLYVIDGGQNSLTYPHDIFHGFPMDDPEESINLQLDEFYMPNQKEWNGANRTSSQINRVDQLIGHDGMFFISGEFTCVTELINTNRLMDEIDEPYAADGSGYVVWANSNGDFFFDNAAYPDPDAPEHLWACIVSDPRNSNRPRTSHSQSDLNGIMLGWGEWLGTNAFGVYAPDGTGTELAGFADESFSTGTESGQKRGYGRQIDADTNYDGLYMMAPMQAEPGYTSFDYYKTCWVANDSDVGIIVPASTTIVEDTPSVFEVAQNSPNPFNPTTTINFSLNYDGQVAVDVYNVAGQKVDTLADDFMTAGNHSVSWEAHEFAAGVYFYTVKSGDFSKTMKMTLLK